MSRLHRLRAAFLAALAVALYANTFGHGYALDDRLVITHNEFTQAGWAGIPDLLKEDSFRGYLGAQANPVFGGRYRPLSLVAFAVEKALFGKSPFAHHLVQVLLYALCCAVFYRVAVEMLGARAGESPPWLSLPFVAALLFTVHPLHTEVVANLKSRDEILALLFALISLSLCLRAAAAPGRRDAIAAAVAFFVALLAKESAVTFLAIIPLSLWFFRKLGRAELARVMPGLAIATCAYLVLRQASVMGGTARPELLNDPFLGVSGADAWATAFYTLWRYLALIFWPHPLTHDYGPYHVAILSWSDLGPWLGFASQLALAGLALSGARTRAVPAYAAAFYLVALSVASNLLFTIGTFMGERFLFAPSAGAALGLAWALLAGIERWVPAALRARVALVAVGIWVSALAVATVIRNPVWRDNETLFRTDITVSSQSASANANLADVLLIRASETREPAERAQLEAEAVAHLETALQVHPSYERALEMLGAVHKRRGDFDGTLAALERLFRLNPRRGNVAFNAGTLILEHHPERGADAVRYLERAVEIRPDDADSHANLGAAYYGVGDLARAITSYERAVALAPERANHRANLEALRAEAAVPSDSR